jgi:DNA primase
MSLPPGFLDELRTRISLSQVVGRKVTWDLRKSNQGKGDMWAPCPFHQEKSASFHVDDRKGFYYCFGCHAKGDALTFLKETENLSFMEAVEMLAREAGMPMPARDPQAAQKADRRSQLTEVMEEAVKHFRLQLRMGHGAAARDYLQRRRLLPEAQERWEIGFAPDARQGLFTALTQKGFAPDLIVDAGLCARPDDGGAPFDRFRGRVIFPIRDGRGRAISLGGRSLDPNARAKYLNGPETELFDKGRNLFNIARAREAAGKDRPLIVAEGYMDTIALSEAGFPATVAPLGTAITEDQLRLIWRLHNEPILALDGDKAGINAALRVIDLALPLLEAGQGLRFALLPDGLDPDDLIKARGGPAMQAVLDAAQPMVNLLWRRETEGRVFDSPERRAALDKVLRSALLRIKDPSIRGHYGEEIKRLRWELFGTRPSARPFVPGSFRRKDEPLPPTASTRGSALANAADPSEPESIIEAVLLATLCLHPSLLLRYESDVEAIEFSNETYAFVQSVMLRVAHQVPVDEIPRIIQEQAGATLETLMANRHVAIAPPVRRASDTAFAAKCFENDLAKLKSRRGKRTEVQHAEHDISGLSDEGVTWRLAQAGEAVHRSERLPMDEGSSQEGDRIDPDRSLDRLIAQAVWEKKRR